MYNLKQLFKVESLLKDLNYPDYKRISKEILDFSKNDIQLTHILLELKTGKPWEYIHGETIFYTLLFKINHNVLIPRIETEQLVSMAIKEYKEKDFDVVIDIGTGSGCIITSIVSSLKIPTINTKPISKTTFYATDISKLALKIAEKNLKKHSLEKTIKLVKGNLLSDIDISKKSVLITANLPYIPTNQYQKLDKSVKNFEPRIALDGGDDGNKYYMELYNQIKQSKVKDFTLILETESSIIKDTKQIFKKYKTTTSKDSFGNPRFLTVRG